MINGSDIATRPSERPVVLLTGFGPFPSVPANATSVLVPRIAEAAERAFAGTRIACHILPTEWGASVERVHHLYRSLRPTLALHFGVSSRATGFEIETRGRNHCHRSKDAAGCLPALDRLSPHGPDYLTTSLPAHHIVERLRRRGLPAIASRDAGGYICNALLYRALELARGAPDAPRAGFIHLPSSLVNERNPARGPLLHCRLDWDGVVDGGLEILAACLGRPPAVSVARRPSRGVYSW